MTHTDEQIKSIWIEFGKSFLDEYPKLNKVSEKDWKWFGNAMLYIRGQSKYPVPTGTECRMHPRAFLYILTIGVRKVIQIVSKVVLHKTPLGIFGLEYPIYDLAGYNLSELDYFKKPKIKQFNLKSLKQVELRNKRESVTTYFKPISEMTEIQLNELRNN